MFHEELIDPTLIATPDDPTDIIQHLDDTFHTRQQYQDYVNRKMMIWRDDTEFKLFHAQYIIHRHDIEHIQRLQKTAQQLLEQADDMQKSHNERIRDLREFIPTMQKQELKRHLKKAAIIPPKQLKKNPFSSQRLSVRNVASRPHPPTSPTPIAGPSDRQPVQIAYRCYQCNAFGHIRPQCSEYRCPYCRVHAPGHIQRDCPEHQQHEQVYPQVPRPLDFNDHIEDPYYVRGEEDGNLGGEC